jgi:endoglucanase
MLTMRFTNTWLLCAALAGGCTQAASLENSPCANHCGDGVLNCGEAAPDCGGECAACADPCANHCSNLIGDCGESAVDCGGDCVACTDPCAGHCGNGAQDCEETGEDCGGECGACVVGLPQLRGLSLAGAEFGESALPGTFGSNYTYPTSAEVDHFMSLGMNVFRLPFRWERLQRQTFASFDQAELSRLESFVSYATGKGAYVLLDPHNYARYYGAVIGSGVSAAAFADFWGKLADRYRTNDHVIFGIMNEPNTMSTEVWLADANAAIAAIRDTGARNLIMVPGNAWTGAHSWYQNWYGTPNAQVMLGIEDPFDNYVIEAHQYLDPNSSGGSMGNCPSRTAGSERLAAFTGWLAEHGLRGFLGEFAAGDSTACLAAIDNLLDYVESHPTEWLGWAYWSAGPWWGNSLGSIEPSGSQDKPQTQVLVDHIPD